MEPGKTEEFLNQTLAGEQSNSPDTITIQRLVLALGLNPEDRDDVNYVSALLTCIKIYRERQVKYGKNWKQHGWMDCFVLFRTKFTRLQRMFWSGKVAPQDRDLDDAYDGINYLAFFIVNVLDNNELGEA